MDFKGQIKKNVGVKYLQKGQKIKAENVCSE
jgi:hypothetical protein